MKHIPTPSLLRIGAVVVAIASVAAAVGGWVALDIIRSTVSVAPDLRQVSDPSSALVAAVEDTIEEVRGSLLTLGDITDQVAASTEDAADVLDEIAVLSTGRIPNALESLQQALPALVDTAAVIDTTMRTLSVLGVEYRPQMPLDEAFAAVETELEGLPESIRTQGERLEALVGEIRSTGADTGLLSRQITTIEENLAAAQITIGAYDTAIASLERLATLGERIDSSIPLARVSLVLLAATGVVLALIGWRLADRISG